MSPSCIAGTTFSTTDDSDFTQSSLVEAFNHQDVVVDLLGQSAVDDRRKVIDAAIEAGVKRFIPSEFSRIMENVANLSIFLTFAERIAIMEYLEEKAAAFPEFSFTALSNGPFYSRALKNAFIGFNLETPTASIYNQPASITTLSPVSQVVGGILSIPAETANKCLFVASFTPSQNEILAILENHSGKWRVENIGVPDAITQGFETSSKGDMSEYVGALMVSTYEPGNGNYFPRNGGISNELRKLPEENLVEVTKAIVDGRDV